MNKSLVVIFCFNVDQNIQKLLNKLKKFKLHNKFEYLIIDDCSTDGTSNILKKIKYKKFKIIKNKKNLGFGKNYKFSINFAKKKNYENLIFLHGDNQYPCEKLSHIVKKLKSNDLCFGSRYLNKRSMKKEMPIERYLANRFLTTLINIIYYYNSSEYFSGLRGIKVKKLKKLKLDIFSNSWVIEQQIHFYFMKKNFKIAEFPIKTSYEKSQKSVIPPVRYVFSVILSILIFKFYQ